MPELNGLKAILESKTLHGIEEPPEDPEEYDAWWVRMHFWVSKKVELHDAAHDR